MKIFKQIFINSMTTIITIAVIGTAYAAISTVSSGDPLTADSWNAIVNKLNNTDTNSTDLVTKSYVDSAISANTGGGYPLTNGISAKSTSVNVSTALSYCDNLIEGGFDDWRLPDMNELLIYSDSISGSDYLITKTYAQGYIAAYRPSSKTLTHVNITHNYYTRCVR